MTNFNSGNLLMISTDRAIFEKDSSVRKRQIEYSKKYQGVYIVVFCSNTISISDKQRDVETGFEYEQIGPNCRVYPTRSRFKIFYPIDALLIARKISKIIKISEVTTQDSSFTAFIGFYIKSRFGTLFEIQIHEDIGSQNYSFYFINRVRRFLSGLFIPRADKIRVVSNRIKEYVEKLIANVSAKKPQIEVRPIVVNTDLVKNSPIIVDLKKKYPQFEKIVLMASRLEKEKNIDLAINSWQKVLGIYPKSGLIIVGRGSKKGFLVNLVNSLGIENSVLFDDWVKSEVLFSYYKTADIFLNTSLYEGYGMTIVEALSSGVKVISTDVGVAKEMGAYIVDYDTESVSKAIVDVLNIKQ